MSNIEWYEDSFNSKVREYNKELQLLVKDKCYISTIHQAGLIKDWREHLYDGLHLTDWAYPSYFKNIKSAVKKLTKEIERERKAKIQK